MATGELPDKQEQNKASKDKKSTFFDRLISELFPTPEERYQQRRRKRRRQNPIRAYIRNMRKEWEYAQYQRREKRRRRRHRRASMKLERREMKQDTPLRQFFKKNFTRETRPYYYYAETDQPKSEVKRQRKRLLHFAINSLILYLIAYFITYLSYQFIVMFVASRYGINSILYFFEVSFPIGNNMAYWTNFNVILITISGPILSLVLGIYYIIGFARKDKTKGLSKLFLLWLGFHSLNFFLGAFVGGVITHQGFGYVIEWSYMPTFLRFGISLIFIFLLGLIGYLNTAVFLESSNSLYWTQRQHKSMLILLGAIVPWAISTVFLFMLKYPPVIPTHENIAIYDSVIYMTFVFMIAPMLFNFNAKPELDQTARRVKGRRVNWIYLILAVCLIFVFRFGLDTGVSYFVFK